jgi:hypothetical protein
MQLPQALSFSILLISLLTLLGCSGHNKKKTTAPVVDSFPVCYGYGCHTVQHVTLSDEQWLTLGTLFSPPANNAATEREQIALAIAQMERFVGSKTNTNDDLPGTFEALFQDLSHQMDCVDEATNTTVYLKLFRERQWITFHQEKARINRGFFFNGWPHTAGMIEELATEHRFAVDSWFHKNGVAPEIIPTKLWYSGWHPEPKNSSN